MGDTNWVKNFTSKADGDAEWAEGMRYLFDDANEKIGDVQKAIACLMRGAQLGNANCMRPQRLYLLDEPSAGLSPKSAQDIIERIRRFARENVNRAIVMVEHRLDLLAWIDRAVFLSQGRVKAETSDSRHFLDPNWLSKNYFE